jgi:hypothetical protein
VSVTQQPALVNFQTIKEKALTRNRSIGFAFISKSRLVTAAIGFGCRTRTVRQLRLAGSRSRQAELQAGADYLAAPAT